MREIREGRVDIRNVRTVPFGTYVCLPSLGPVGSPDVTYFMYGLFFFACVYGVPVDASIWIIMDGCDV